MSMKTKIWHNGKTAVTDEKPIELISYISTRNAKIINEINPEISKNYRNPKRIYEASTRSTTDLDIIQIEYGGSRLCYFGRWNSGKKGLNPIELKETLTLIGKFESLNRIINASEWDNVQYIGNYSVLGDIIKCWDGGEENRYNDFVLYLGNWNDGII